MKPPRLSVKELAAFIGVNTDSIRRTYRKGEIPAIRVKTALKFDLDEVRKCLQRNAKARFGTRLASAPGGASAGRAGCDGNFGA